MRHDLTLQDGDLTLRPLTEADIPALCALAGTCADELRLMGSPPHQAAYYWAALDAPDQLPFVVEVGGELAGSTRYGDIRTAHSGLEIGWTWLHPRWHGSGVNRRMKRLLLQHAFGDLGMARVQIKTDSLNVRSQRAIEKLGAVREGVLRAHMRRPDGSLRDTVMYSVTREDWPEVQRHLGGDGDAGDGGER
ncbi:acetyltransferase [Deinococcus phoenicis]|uniref:Acetyltransferase n=1 Tax=Deinococcus phoenicis TaxID=1476583 RepID=A0A016QUP1_9DEIO|nr:GNAT family protein [Deinococcus phoenicis]EYB69567.1 acetyltransferase [Deinococcus phoenicis]